MTEGQSLEHYYPQYIIILIGINNLITESISENELGDTPENTFAGIKTIVEYLKKIRPEANILLLGIFPCGEKPNTPLRDGIKQTNKMIKTLADYKDIYFADFGEAFLEKDGSMDKTVFRDFVHLSPKGYEIWANVMEPYLKAFLDKNEQAVIW